MNRERRKEYLEQRNVWIWYQVRSRSMTMREAGAPFNISRQRVQLICRAYDKWVESLDFAEALADSKKAKAKNKSDKWASL